MLLYDISPTVSRRLAVWPGDTPVSREVLLEIERGDNITLSTLRGTVHAGAHADAPSHYAAGGQSIEQRRLDAYLGPCHVQRVPVAPGTRIRPADLAEPIRAPRLLLRTETHRNPESFDESFAALDPELVDFAHAVGVVLIGVDTPSVDLFPSKDLPAHARFARHNMAILEGLVLDAVPDGIYELIALPLKLEGFDASPVRAVLRRPRPG